MFFYLAAFAQLLSDPFTSFEVLYGFIIATGKGNTMIIQRDARSMTVHCEKIRMKGYGLSRWAEPLPLQEGAGFLLASA